MNIYSGRSILAGLMLFCLAGCGFHLRTPTPLNPALQQPYLETPAPYSHFTQTLLARFRLSGAQPAATPQSASAILVILGEHETQTLLSVSSTQSTRQYRLSLTVTFQITDPQGRVLVGPETLAESRTLTMASDQILSSSNEVQNLYRPIRMALVQDVMNRLTSHEISAILTDSKHVGRK